MIVSVSISRLMGFSIDDPEKDKKIIIHNFMRELCRRDDEYNRNRNRDSNVFPVEEIRQRDLDAFDIEYVKRLRGSPYFCVSISSNSCCVVLLITPHFDTGEDPCIKLSSLLTILLT
jgi:hypothetical protein